jgi:glycosyltransferase involved in cell wall biosynthesis
MVVVSVIIASKNNGDTIDVCLKSIVNQVRFGGDLEIIVADGMSTDSTPKVLSKYSTFIKVVNDSGKSLTKARNLGLKHSTGDYILHIDADYFLHPNTIYKCLEYFIEGYDAIVLKEGITKGMGEWREVRSWDNVIKSMFAKLTEPVGKGLGYPRAFKRGILEKIGGHNERIAFYGEDAEICWRLFKNNAKIHYASDAIYYKIEEKNPKETWHKCFRYGILTPTMFKYSKRYALVTILGSCVNTFSLVISLPMFFVGLTLSKSMKIASKLLFCSYLRMAAQFCGTMNYLLKGYCEK